MTKQYTIVIPSDIFFSENALHEYLEDNDVSDILNALVLEQGYDNVSEMLHDLDYWELGDVVICAFHSDDSADWPISLNDDGLLFWSDDGED